MYLSPPERRAVGRGSTAALHSDVLSGEVRGRQSLLRGPGRISPLFLHYCQRRGHLARHRGPPCLRQMVPRETCALGLLSRSGSETFDTGHNGPAGLASAPVCVPHGPGRIRTADLRVVSAPSSPLDYRPSDRAGADPVLQPAVRGASAGAGSEASVAPARPSP